MGALSHLRPGSTCWGACHGCGGGVCRWHGRACRHCRQKTKGVMATPMQRANHTGNPSRYVGACGTMHVCSGCIPEVTEARKAGRMPQRAIATAAIFALLDGFTGCPSVIRTKRDLPHCLAVLHQWLPNAHSSASAVVRLASYTLHCARFQSCPALWPLCPLACSLSCSTQ